MVQQEQGQNLGRQEEAGVAAHQGQGQQQGQGLQQEEADDKRAPLAAAAADPQAMQQWLVAVISLPRLTCLMLRDLPEQTAMAVDSIAADPAGIAAATQLTCLELDCGTNLAVNLLVNSLTGLRELYIGCPGVNDDVLADMAVKLTRLERLSVAATAVKIADRVALKSAFSGLQHFSMPFRVSAEGSCWWEFG